MDMHVRIHIGLHNLTTLMPKCNVVLHLPKYSVRAEYYIHKFPLLHSQVLFYFYGPFMPTLVHPSDPISPKTLCNQQTPLFS
eukprot:TRINITY_DN694_c1_g1_i1.p2 TRINITY_DN694_c1_g1~~TRINITY_DN694_c1_g1_i1.p2  ORF type:complete len:82 (+),score=5.46 TRINITY_DN694_c1_g1_i1:289-534(+)